MPLRHWLQLTLTEGIGPILARRLIDSAGGIEAACDANVALLRNIEGIGQAKASKIHQSLREAAQQVDDEIERATAAKASIICPDDQEYPFLLRSISDPPSVLYVRGTLEPRDLHAVAIVGSRRCSHYGREQAERFGALLAGAGVTVTSGGARGIDSAAHRGAISHAQGRTIAVLGCGVDIAYPPENDRLFAQIAERGAVISEHPMSTPPVAENFPRRNRIVSGMSRGVLVVEADIRSGALITARQANEDHGRPVFALPGRVDNAMSAGPHKLIRDGAILVTSLEDILEGLGPLPLEANLPDSFIAPVSEGIDETVETARQSPAVSSTSASVLTETQQQIVAIMDGQPVSVDTIIERTSLPANIILRDLTMLTLKAVVRRVDGQTFCKIGGDKS